MTMPVHTVSKMPSKFKGRKARKEAHAHELATTKSHGEIAGQPFVVFGATRTGMGARQVLPNVLDLATKPKR